MISTTEGKMVMTKSQTITVTEPERQALFAAIAYFETMYQGDPEPPRYWEKSLKDAVKVVEKLNTAGDQGNQ
jgi:hypothetical protein